MRSGLVRSLGAAACALVLTLTAACSDDGEPSPRAGGSSAATDGASPSTTAGEAQASAYPVAPSASPSPLPDLGSRTGGPFTSTLNAVRRASAQAVVVEGSLSVADGVDLLVGLEEPGFAYREVGGERLNTYEVSAVSLPVAGDPLVHQALRDEQGLCACTQGVRSVKSGQPLGVHTCVTAPEDASTVTVTVAGFAPFTDVQVDG